MSNRYTENNVQENDQLLDLVRLPARNLESRIKELEAAVKERQKISWDALSVLGTEKLRLEDRLDRMRYAGLAGGVSPIEATMRRNKMNLDQTVTGELVGCFNDIQRLKDQLREAREELALEQQRLQLVRSISDISESNGIHNKDGPNRNIAGINGLSIRDTRPARTGLLRGK